MEVTWAVFKQFASSRGASIQCIDINDTYFLKVADSGVTLTCALYKLNEDTTEKLDFETNFQPSANKPSPLLSAALTEPNGFRFRGTRIVAQAMPANATTVVDYTLTEERYLTGAVVKAYSPGHFDYVKLEVVAPANHPLTGAPVEVVLDAFAPSWGISEDMQILDLYKARIYANLIIRVTYVNTTNSAVDFWINAFLHKKA